jgi:gas vesicle protein
MTDNANDYVSEGEYEVSGSNTAVIGVALLLIGFAAGALAAALLTPKTGKQMRRTLKRRVNDLREAAEDWSEQAGDIRERASEFADKAGEWAEAAKDRVAPLAKKFRS